MRIWRRSIQWQLIASMGAALLASILVVVAIYTVAVNRLTDRYLVDTALPASIEAIRNDIERMLGQPLTAAADIAGNTLLRDWLAAGENPAEAPRFIEYLEAAKQRNRAFTTLFASTETGHYYNEKGLDRTLSRDNPKDTWFYGYIDSGAERLINIDIDGSTGELALFIDYRVEKNGQLVGVAGMGLRMTELSKLIHDFSFGEHGRVMLVRNDGLIQVHPENTFSGKRQLTEQIGAEAAKAVMAAGDNLHSTRFSRDGEDYLALGLPLRDLNWTLVAEVPEAEIYAQARQAVWLTSLIGGAVALVSLLLVVLMARGLVRPIRQVTAALVQIGSGGGDLSQRLDDSREDELGDLARGFNQFVDSQRALIGEVLRTTERLHLAVGQVTRVVDNTAERSGRQQEMTEMVATAVHEMGLTVQDIARNAGDAAQASQSARDEALQAREVVRRSIQGIEGMSGDIGKAADAVAQLADEVSSIDEVLAVIRSISEQTNLLALNAAIEAARAGEMGRGFAVVADEVRTLARRTQVSTDEVQHMIQRLKHGAGMAVSSMQAGQQATGSGVESSQRTGTSLGAITDQVEHISDMNSQVATATEEQSAVTEEINRTVQGISDLARETAAEVQGCRQECQALRGLTDDLARQMGGFKL
ncbi:methyl-accepting chemotaxis protein [Pseudomonas sp. Rh2]|uniref:Methyl-accepting chemotaxis protein n=3 Tax=Pseudomonas TaxID=286 RepID=A0ABR6V9K6_9PSED|nr:MULTISPECIES: methyl-accepting chemotaxis protein [Pseudomonas]AGZ37515.1 methyl-accepting chemotaxis sensory transducer [Pseudomonas sp. VLB120]MBC3477152.1 methyl-accepting chemotaxis protein [Pseudomonas taiwanensis]MBC3489966.1 methyl-accepting chemotaxis protein [Pseudomonas taiwanensis]MDT8926585.1 methyl-accepting chemotaxis protein [Pseudomonas taiwanensis]MPS99062.1 methyl-accepting chemotaxis protein [Pseudomonas sp.]